ncbi:MAG TPA: hypothetical protein VMV95_03025 [Bacillota bacterium]|nr:hypothetical protein [Bacillota bacterium]
MKREEKRRIEEEKTIRELLGEEESKKYWAAPADYTNKMLSSCIGRIEKTSNSPAILRQTEIIKKLQGVVFMEKEKDEIGKTKFLELLEKEPKYDEDGNIEDQDARTEWQEELIKAFNEDVLQEYDEDKSLENKLIDLEESIAELKKDLGKHKHLPTGETVKELD